MDPNNNNGGESSGSETDSASEESQTKQVTNNNSGELSSDSSGIEATSSFDYKSYIEQLNANQRLLQAPNMSEEQVLLCRLDFEIAASGSINRSAPLTGEDKARNVEAFPARQRKNSACERS
ncbi:hypothetical protein PanWU01x14_238770 [Parasponia andersonii]|uniref:Uncharacterized protein n=1 Tax=Parasponia andersonii TaxID=3476 RepID=A0A2P5BHI8_PARAD|nr:hypothetical protein PanWU01x14_238770 [Parasponia andersonii]